MKTVNPNFAHQILSECAKMYLTLPEDKFPNLEEWNAMEDSDRLQLIADNAWEPLEGRDPNWIWEQIECAADNIIYTIGNANQIFEA